MRLSEPATGDEFIILSDLHLSAGPDRARAGPGSITSAVAAFAGQVLGDPGADRRRLVLLGDTLDLPTHHSGPRRAGRSSALESWTSAAADAAGRIADAHRAAFDALAAFVAAGGRIELLAGNHDVALQLPAVRSALIERLGGATGRVAWHPWTLHVPGMLWAEHGGQHHDLHAIPEWLSPPPDRSSWGLPPGRALEALSVALHRRRSGRPVVAAGVAVAADLLAAAVARPALARRRIAHRSRELPSVAAASGIPERVLERVDRLSEADAWSIAARLVRQRLAGADPGPASFLGPAARRIDAILRAGGLGVAVYAFGHTHAPAILPLDGTDAGPWFANAGSWAGLRPTALRRRLGPDRLPFLRVGGPAGARPPVVLELWNAALGRVEDLPPGR